MNEARGKVRQNLISSQNFICLSGKIKLYYIKRVMNVFAVINYDNEFFRDDSFDNFEKLLADYIFKFT